MYARASDDEWSKWTGLAVGANVDSSSAARLTDMDFSPAMRQRFDDVARAMLQVNAGTAQRAVAEEL